MSHQINSTQKSFDIDLSGVYYDDLLKFCKKNSSYKLVLVKHQIKCYQHQILGLCTFEIHQIPQYITNFIADGYNNDIELVIRESDLEQQIVQHLFNMYVRIPNFMHNKIYSLKITKLSVTNEKKILFADENEIKILFTDENDLMEPSYICDIRFDGYIWAKAQCTCKN